MLNPLFAIDLGGPALLVVGVFVVTFLIVSWIAYGLLSGQKHAAPPPPEEPGGESSGTVAAEGPAPLSDAAPVTESGVRFDVRSLLEKVRVQVTRREPPPAAMTEAQKTRAVDMIREGLPISEAARTVYPDFDRLDEGSREALESALQEMAKTR
jgi:hypothetical protein